MSKHQWFDPRGRDQDSRVALTLDNNLAEEGWNPSTPEYWEELSDRMRRYIPHKFAAADREEEKTGQRQTTGGSDRDGGGSTSRGAYVLSGERVRALKEAGMWDQFQSDSKFKARMLARYREQDDRSKS
jgi:hypothetical protein